ncbi:MAG: hypothetical protein LBJ12_04140 [Oscillospiraceae bacterium]|jgi:hypothetical protein|nr:hypothetical protein [Oscillospiraceae bacterium]
MEVYQRNAWGFIKGLGLTVGGSAALAVLLYMFTANYWLAVGVGLVVFALLLYITIFKDAIRFELENGMMRYLVRGKEEHRFNLAQCAARYQIKTNNGSAGSISLYISELKSDGQYGEEIYIDCEPLGETQFMKLFASMEKTSKVMEPRQLEIQKL